MCVRRQPYQLPKKSGPAAGLERRCVAVSLEDKCSRFANFFYRPLKQGDHAESSLAASRNYQKRSQTKLRMSLAKKLARASKPAKAVNLIADFHSSCRNLFERANTLRQTDLSYWIEDVQDALKLGKRAGLACTDEAFFRHILPAISALARRHLTDREQIKALLRIAAESIPWYDPRFESLQSIETRLAVDDARQISEILHAVASHVRHIEVESFDERQDLMTSLALLQFPSAVDRRALDAALMSKKRFLTLVTSDLQFREAVFAIRSTDDAVDFPRRWSRPAERVPNWYWVEMLDSLLQAELPSTPSVDHICEYMRVCTDLIDAAAAAEVLQKADFLPLQFRVKDLLRRIDSLDHGWGSLFDARLHQTMLDFLVRQVQIVFHQGSTVYLDDIITKAIERALRFHPTLDFRNSIWPLLIQLGHSRLTAKTYGIPSILAVAVEEGKIDAEYLTQHDFVQRLLLAFPAEKVKMLTAISSRPRSRSSLLPSSATSELPNAEVAFGKCMRVEGSDVDRTDKENVIVRAFKDLCSEIVSNVAKHQDTDRQEGRHAVLGTRCNYQEINLPAVRRIVQYVDEHSEMSVAARAEILTSAMNAFNFCGEQVQVRDLYDQLRRFSMQDKLGGVWFSRAISIVRGLSGRYC